MLRSLVALLIFQCLGESVFYVFSLPVHGPVIGMLLLFAFAMFRPAAAEVIEPTALELLRHLSLLLSAHWILDNVCVHEPEVRGFAIGVASHGIGTARAFQVSEEMGAFSGLGMGLNGVFIAFVVPDLLPVLLQ
ncbi:LrgB family protein [Paraburkholderia sp. A3BS-1L]